MKKVPLLFFVLTCKFSVLAQSNKEPFKLSEYYRKIIKIPEPVKADCGIALFNRVVVNDVRYDSSAVAIDLNNYYRIFGKSRSLERYLNLSLGLSDSNTTGNQLVIFIKKLWLTDKFERDSTVYDTEAFIPGIFFKIECFYKVDSVYFPAFKYDASCSYGSYDTENIFNSAPKLIDSCLKKIVGRIISFQNTGVSSLKRQMTLPEVVRYYKSAVELPILKDSVLNKGVYLTYDDFKKNKPRYTSFEVQKRSLNDIVYLKEAGGKDILLKNVWGYSDGDTLFIKRSQHFCPLRRLGNTFYFINKSFLVSTEKIPSFNKYSPFMYESITVYHEKYNLYQLDMETGEGF